MFLKKLWCHSAEVKELTYARNDQWPNPLLLLLLFYYLSDGGHSPALGWTELRHDNQPISLSVCMLGSTGVCYSINIRRPPHSMCPSVETMDYVENEETFDAIRLFEYWRSSKLFSSCVPEFKLASTKRYYSPSFQLFFSPLLRF